MLRKIKNELFVIFIAVVALFAIIPIVTYGYFAKDLTSKDAVMNRNDTGLVLLDRNDKPFFTFYQPKHKIVVSLSQIPPMVQHAVIAAEDMDFYEHPGFSIKSILRSIFLDVKEQKIAYGGSTITQQLVKNSLLTANKSLLRKYQEIVLAQEIERRFSKKEILEMYLNSVYFGEGAFGIEEAAQTYFGIPAQKLSLAQAAQLAAVLPSPSRLSPKSGDKQAAKKRQVYVLSNMVKKKYITTQQKTAALKEPIVFAVDEEPLNTFAPHFAIMVRDELVKQYGEEYISRSGFKVRTTIDVDWQEYAEQEVKRQVQVLAQNRVTNGAAVAIDPKNGEVRVMVGSVNWYNSEFGKVNVAVTPRQPGSSFKPIVYLSGFETGAITPATLLHDQPTKFPIDYSPKNYDGKFRGPLLPRRALSNSLNVPAVEVLQKTGIEPALVMGKRLGLTTLNADYYGLSMVLGTAEVKLVELTNVYATFANQGKKNEITYITRIFDKNNRIVYHAKPKTEQVVEPQYTFLISSILSDNKARAEVFGNVLNISRPAAVKTGTTENYKDAWTMGYTPSLAIGVWVGNNDGKTMDTIAGSLGAAPIWKNLMEHFLTGVAVEKFEPPPNLIAATLCTQYQSSQKDASRSAQIQVIEYFVKGTEPTSSCGSSAAQAISPTALPAVSLSPTFAPTILPSPTGVSVSGQVSIQKSFIKDEKERKND